MEILEYREGNVHILGLKGRLDASSAPELQERLATLIEGGETRFLLDCADLDYLSSVGVRVLLGAAHELAGRGGRIACCSPTANVRAVFEILALESEAPIFETRRIGLAALGGGPA